MDFLAENIYFPMEFASGCKDTEIWAQGRDGVDGSVCWSQAGLGLQKAR